MRIRRRRVRARCWLLTIMPLVDTFSRIRSQLESKNGPNCFPDLSTLQDERVLARNHHTFVSERPTKTYEDYERRTRHRFTGYDSLAHVPYRPFAGLKHTDPYRLIEDTLGISLEQAEIHQSFSDSVKECTKSSSFTNQQTIRVVRACSKKKSQVLSKTAGLSAIQLHLGSTSRAMREIAAGAAYHDTIPREKERRSFISDMRAPKPLKREKSTSGDDHCVYNPSIYLPTLVHTASSKACLTSQRPAQPHLQTLSDNKDSLEQKFLNSSELPEEEVREEAQCPRVGPNIYVAVAAAQFKLHFSHPSKKEEISCAKKLQMRKCLIKIKFIYSILCCLYNMKVKDLKNKHPLSMASIKQMSVKLLPSKESTYYPAHRLGTHPHTYNTHTPSYLLQQHKNTGHHIETWEDLMLVTRSPGHHTTDTTSPLTTAASGPCLEPHQKIARALPPWQRQVVFVDSCENNANDPAVVIAECIAGFQSSKDQISVQTKSLLYQRQKTISHLLGVKARELKLTAIAESCLQDMREKAYCISRSERANEKNRPAWFGELEKEVSSAFESCTRNQQSLERTTRDLLEMMKSFLYSDIHNIPRVMEKFCLLVMSIPSDLLCLTPVIAAVKFVLEHIVEVPARLCQQWLEMRGLPTTGIALTTQPVIVFGLTV